MTRTNHESRITAAPSTTATAAIHAWLDQFAAAVRAADYDAARLLFDANVMSFGTFASKVTGIAGLVEGQWKNIWSCTRNFRFLMSEAHVEVSDAIAWVASPWISQGRDEAGRWYDRTGRCTLVLAHRGERWLCVHSHFSREPAPKIGGSATPA